jgi:hypothetical protein
MLVLAVLLPLAICAQTSLPIPVSGDAGGGAAPMQADLLSLAYSNMLAGNYEVAKSQYGSLRELEPANLAAHEGYLWALNALGKYRESLSQSAKLIKGYPYTAQFHNYRAYALLQSRRYPEARYYYRYALDKQAQNPLASSIANEGLAYSYKALGDYIKHRRYINAHAAGTGIPAAKPKPSFGTALGFSATQPDKAAISIRQTVNYASWHMNVAYEDFSINKEHFRYAISAALGKQLAIADVEIYAMQLSGEDQRVYPSQQLGCKLSQNLYLGKVAISPRLMASYSQYPRFDIQQLSIMPVLHWRDISLSYQAHYGFMDNETVNADSSRICQQMELQKAMPFGTTLGLHYGQGDGRWMMDSHGVVVDTFNTQEPYYAASLLIPFLSRFSAYLYCQVSNDTGLYFASLKVNY